MVGVLLATLGSGPGRVEPRVRWEAPPGCGTAGELRERVTRQLGTLEAGIEIVGRVRQVEGLYALELELVVDGERQRRSFSTEECRTLLDAAVIVSSAALGPSAEAATEVPARVPEPTVAGDPGPVVPEPTSLPPAGPASASTAVRGAAPGPASPVRTSTSAAVRGGASAREDGVALPTGAPASSPERTRERTPERTPERAARPGQWLVSARGGLGYDGTLAAPQGSLGFGRAWSRWRVQALLDAFGGRAHGPRGTLDLGVVTVTPRVCATLGMRAPIELSPCAGVALGAAVGRGRDVLNARTAVVPWLAAHLDFGVRVVPRRWLAVGLELSNYAMPGRPLFMLSDRQTVYRAGPAGSRALLTLELRFSATDSSRAGH